MKNIRNFLLLVFFCCPLQLQAEEDCNLIEILKESEKISALEKEKSLDFLNKAISKCYENTKEFADILNQRGEVFKQFDKDFEAKEDFEKALIIVRTQDKNVLREGKYLQNLGNAYIGLGDYSKAEEIINEAISILQKVKSKGEKYLIFAYSGLGMSFNQQGKYSSANKAHEKAVNLSKSFFGDEDPEHAIVLNNQAVNFNKQSLFEAGESALRKALPIYEKHPLKHREGIAITSNNLAANLMSQGKYEEAQMYLENSLEMIRLINKEDSVTEAIMLFNIAENFRQQYKQGESQTYFSQSVEMAQRVLGQDHPSVANLKHGLAVNFREAGKVKESNKINNEIHEIYKKNYDKDSNRIADIYTFLSRDAKDLKDYEKAEFYFSEAIRIYSLNKGRDISEVSKELSNFGAFLDSMSRFDEGEKKHIEAVKIIETIGKGTLAHYKRKHFLAKHYFKRGKYKEALLTELEAYEILKELKATDMGSTKAEALSDLSEFFSLNGFMDIALKYAEEASTEFEQHLLRTGNKTPTYEMKNYEAVKRHSSNYVDLLFQEGSDISIQKAFEVSQIASVSPVSFAIKRNDQRKFYSTKKAKIKQHQDSVEKRRLIQKKLDVLNAAKESKEDEKLRLINDRDFLDALISGNGKIIKRFYPEYSATIIPLSRSIEETQNKLNSSTLLIKFFIGKEKIYAWAITKNSFYSYQLALTPNNLKETIETIRTENLKSYSKLEDYPFEISNLLYKQLIKPSVDEFPNVSHLFIIPDKDLHRLSFQSLVFKEPINIKIDGISWLIKKMPVNILPSVSSFVDLNLKKKSQSINTFFGVGNPILEGTNRESISRSGELGVKEIRFLSKLPETESELEKIANLIGKTKSKLLIREEATDHNIFTADLSEFDLISFATHAVNADIGYGLSEAGLVVSGQNSKDIDDWLVSSSEIRNLNLNAQLVILSACNTGAISSLGQSAYSGLAESFFYAGANTLLVSQWDVDSLSAVEITTQMLSFYKDNRSLTMSEALQKSILHLMSNNEKYRHPFFWAPFVVLGIN